MSANSTTGTIGRYVKKIPRIPSWLLDRVRWDLLPRIRRMVLKYSSYDYDQLFSVLSRLTGVSSQAVREYYQELGGKGVLRELETQLRSVPELASEHRLINQLGMEKYVRLDRTALYAVVRAVRPDVF